jgi:Na+/melibiose symporter-like transporter
MFLFAQKAPDAGALGAGLGVIFFVWICLAATAGIISILFWIFLLMSTFKAFKAVSERNRDMQPGMVFLMLIPCFGIPIWYIFVVLRLSSSLEKEYADRGIRAEGDFGKMMGLLALIPCLTPIFMIIWLLKIRGYTAKLEGKKGRGKADDED